MLSNKQFSDDFMGCVRIKVSELVENGGKKVDRWYPLQPENYTGAWDGIRHGESRKRSTSGGEDGGEDTAFRDDGSGDQGDSVGDRATAARAKAPSLRRSAETAGASHIQQQLAGCCPFGQGTSAVEDVAADADRRGSRARGAKRGSGRAMDLGLLRIVVQIRGPGDRESILRKNDEVFGGAEALLKMKSLSSGATTAKGPGLKTSEEASTKDAKKKAGDGTGAVLDMAKGKPKGGGAWGAAMGGMSGVVDSLLMKNNDDYTIGSNGAASFTLNRATGAGSGRSETKSDGGNGVGGTLASSMMKAAGKESQREVGQLVSASPLSRKEQQTQGSGGKESNGDISGSSARKQVAVATDSAAGASATGAKVAAGGGQKTGLRARGGKLKSMSKHWKKVHSSLGRALPRMSRNESVLDKMMPADGASSGGGGGGGGGGGMNNAKAEEIMTELRSSMGMITQNAERGKENARQLAALASKVDEALGLLRSASAKEAT